MEPVPPVIYLSSSITVGGWGGAGEVGRRSLSSASTSMHTEQQV
jgi:hypothetical protein